jgi:hypothetical protein
VAGSEDDIELHPKRKANPDQKFIYAGNKDLKKLQKVAWEAGWWPEEKKGGKILWLAPNQIGQVLVHTTSSDHHAYDNCLGLFRNAGLDV